METTVKTDPVLAIAGVTGAVGAELIATLDKRQFPVGKLKALASARSAGKTLDFRGQKIVIEALTENYLVPGGAPLRASLHREEADHRDRSDATRAAAFS